MSQRLIVLLYLVLLTGCGIWAGVLLLEARAEYGQLKLVQAASLAKLAAAEARLREQETIGRSIPGVQNRFHRSFKLWCALADAGPACASCEASCRTTYSASSRTPPINDEPIR